MADKTLKIRGLSVGRQLDNPDDRAETLVGTPYYLSPEVAQHQPYNHKVESPLTIDIPFPV